MPSSTDSAQKTAASYKNASRRAVSVTPVARLESSTEKLQASVLSGAQEDSDSRNLSKVGTSDARTVLFSMKDDREKAGAPDSEKLIIQLGLENWRCGGSKPNGKPCQRLIRETRQAKIRSQLEKILAPQQSNENLDDELETLVMLVHCHSHDHGYAKEDRLELWANIFPQSSANSTATIGKNIKKALGRVTNQCIGINLQKERCGRTISGQRVQNCLRTIDEILQPDIYKDIKLQGYLRVLEVNMYCPSHINKQGYKMLTTWELSIVEILEKFEVELIRDADLLIFSVEEAAGAINGESVPESTYATKETVWHNGRLPTPRNTRSLSPEFYHSPSEFWPSALDASIFKRLPRLDGIPNPKECHSQVEKVVTRDLAKTHKIEGYVYLYEVEGNRGLVKVGYTKKLEKRHKDWAFDCNRETRLLYPLPEDGLVKVPNAPRVEALCHSELDYCRIRVYCEACLKEHIEWFEISPEECIQVVKKWSRWMRSDPFESSPSNQKSRLKREEMEKTTDMDEFMTSVATLGVGADQ